MALAVSLHAPNDELRNELVPINRNHPIAELLAACWHYIDKQNGRSITFEYVMLDGINDKPEHARQLARLMGTSRQAQSDSLQRVPGHALPAIAGGGDCAFPRHLSTKRRHCDHPPTRGDDIDAACGQLAGRVSTAPWCGSAPVAHLDARRR